MSANTNINRKIDPELTGLHTTNDPDSRNLSHSTTFNNYIQHVKNQQAGTHPIPNNELSMKKAGQKE